MWEPSLLLEGFGVAKARDVSETKQLRNHRVVCQKFSKQNFDSFPRVIVDSCVFYKVVC